MRPIILLDMDGPIANTDQACWNLACEIATAVGESHPFDIDTIASGRHRFYTDHIISPYVRSTVRRVIDNIGWFETLPPTPGAKEAMEELSQLAEVWVCSKPLEANPTCRDAKARWLDQHIGDGWSSKLIMAPDKSLILGSLLLDDAIKPHWLNRAHWQPVVFEASWNNYGTTYGQDWPRFTWDDGVEALLEYV